MVSKHRNGFKNALMAVAIAFGLIFAGFGGAVLSPDHHASARVEDGGRTIPVRASAAATATGTTSTFCGLGNFTKYAMQLVVSAASGTTPTLDLTWQHSIDGGTTWFTVVAFTQATGVTSALKVESEVEAATAEVWGNCMRASYTIGGTTPSFTFKIDLFAQ